MYQLFRTHILAQRIPIVKAGNDEVLSAWCLVLRVGFITARWWHRTSVLSSQPPDDRAGIFAVMKPLLAFSPGLDDPDMQLTKLPFAHGRRRAHE